MSHLAKSYMEIQILRRRFLARVYFSSYLGIIGIKFLGNHCTEWLAVYSLYLESYLVVFRQVRKWKMLSRHHNDSKVREAESDGHVICPWVMSPLLGSPVLLECCICNGPFITYGHEEAWQPRQRTQVSKETLTHAHKRITVSHAKCMNINTLDDM